MEYVKCGNYLIPNLKLTHPSQHFGRWGRLYREYLQAHHPVRFTTLTLNNQLGDVLATFDKQANDRLNHIMEQMQSAEGVSEVLKEQNMIAWVQAMNSIRNRAEEIVRKELLYCEEDES